MYQITDYDSTYYGVDYMHTSIVAMYKFQSPPNKYLVDCVGGVYHELKYCSILIIIASILGTGWGGGGGGASNPRTIL